MPFSSSLGKHYAFLCARSPLCGALFCRFRKPLEVSPATGAVEGVQIYYELEVQQQEGRQFRGYVFYPIESTQAALEATLFRSITAPEPTPRSDRTLARPGLGSDAVARAER